MVADIKLEDNVVSVEDTDPAKPIKQLKVKCWDLVIDAPDRRKNQTGERRALVHNPSDGLTLNWGKDYPDGVTIEGDVKMNKIVTTGNPLLIEGNTYLHGSIYIEPTESSLPRTYIQIEHDTIKLITESKIPGTKPGIQGQRPLKAPSTSTDELDFVKIINQLRVCVRKLCKLHDVQTPPDL